jgi:hypothetical protein
VNRFRAALVTAGVFMSVAVPTAAGPPIPFPPAGSVAIGPPFGSRGVITACWIDARYFRNLRNGVVDYCREHLRYAPGTLDCYQFTDRVCSVFLPDSVEWVETRETVAPAVFPCPDAPEPPVCPRMR